MPPGEPAGPTSGQDTGFDWSWLFPSGSAQPGPPGGGRYGRPPRVDPNDPIANWLNQLFSGGTPEDQLTQVIVDKMGGAVALGKQSTVNAARMNAARWAAHRAMNDPAYREQLAQSIGWNMANPHVAYWVMHGGGVPSDPLGTGNAPGSAAGAAPGTAAKPGVAAAPAATIGSPFDASKYGGAGDPGYTYGAVLDPQFAAAAGVDRQWGVDYALPLGTPQNSPFAGTIKEAGFNGPYGNTVVVQMANGYTYRVAHLESIPAGITVGATVAVGTELGPTGSTGNSSGSHVLIEMRDPQGKPVDPTPMIDKLLAGDTIGAQAYSTTTRPPTRRSDRSRLTTDTCSTPARRTTPCFSPLSRCGASAMEATRRGPSCPR
jgi:murein DD-endopeptidase MepM/ murein hydrolase activator NlpD